MAQVAGKNKTEDEEGSRLGGFFVFERSYPVLPAL